MKIVCLGDSLTYGYGVPRKDTWVSLLNKNGTAAYVNKGINGDTTGDMLARFEQDVLAENPNIVIMMGGANDFIRGLGLEAVQKNIMAMVEMATGNQIIPVVGAPFRIKAETVRADWAAWADFREVAEKIKLLRNWIIDFSTTSHIEYLDFYHEFTARTSGEYNSYFRDGLHPNKRGQQIIAEIVGEKVDGILNDHNRKELR
ncbi:MAG: GDSL-type esterase/lipase family protein [Bacillota bacterium]